MQQQRTTIVSLGVFATSLILVGVGCFNRPAPPAPSPSSTADILDEVTAETDASLLLSGVYQIDGSESTMEWFGKRRVGNQHRGTIDVSYGQVTFGDQGALLNGSFIIDMDTIEEDTDNQMVERHLRSDDFFATETFPESRFLLTQATPVQGSQYTVTGDLTIKETTKEITFPATIVAESPERVRATATFQINRADFDVQYGSGTFFDNLGDSLIEDEIEFTLDLVAERASDTLLLPAEDIVVAEEDDLTEEETEEVDVSAEE